MKSEDAIFFDKNVEASIPIVPRMLRLFLPDVDEDEDDDDDEGEDEDDDVVEIVPCMLRPLLPDNQIIFVYMCMMMTMMMMWMITLSQWAGHRATQRAEEVGG